MSLELVNIEKMSDCENSDTSIDLTDDDKKYIEKLMVKHYEVKAHKGRFKCALTCHICDKIQLSENPESTNTFLDFIFMEHDNDFEFTKEKRQKIIQSLVHDYVKPELKEERNPRNIKFTGNKVNRRFVARKSLISRNRYSARPLRERKATRLIPERASRVYNVKDNKDSEKPVNKHYMTPNNRYKTIFRKIKSNPEENKHDLTKYPKNDETTPKTVLKIEVRPKSVILKNVSQESQSNKYNVKPLKLLGAQRRVAFVETGLSQTENMNSFKTRGSAVTKPDVKYLTAIRKVEPEGNKENSFIVPHRSLRTIKSWRRQNDNFHRTQTERPPQMKDPRSPFYIPECYIAVYQQGLALRGWNPTQVLYEICGYCGWGKPEFLEGGDVLEGFLCCVRVKGVGFLGRTRGKTKKVARHLASTRFLNEIGFRFVFNILAFLSRASTRTAVRSWFPLEQRRYKMHPRIREH